MPRPPTNTPAQALRPDARHHRLRSGARTTGPTRTSLPKAPPQGLSLYDSAPSPHAGCSQTLSLQRQKDSPFLVLVPFALRGRGPAQPQTAIAARATSAAQAAWEVNLFI